MVSKGLTALLILSLALLGLAQSQTRQPVTGAPFDQRPGVGAPLRRSINELQAAGGPQWDLYLLALSSLQLEKDEEELGYFQVEGIHGAPFIQWNGAGPRVNGDWGGYCPHSASASRQDLHSVRLLIPTQENLFLSWHRAYVALFEQVLVARAKQLASLYPERLRAQYVQAAETLRQPYWDWAADPQVPPSTIPPLIAVIHPTEGKQVNINNPLYTFRIPPAVLNGKYGPFDADRRPQTLRCPAPNSYPASANNLMTQRPYKQWIYDVLTRARDFTEFSLQGNITSLEQIHNGIHWDAGCAGMFLDQSLTAFDPLFMLHHSFVDRIWAFWQALRPDQEVFQTAYAARARFSTAAGTSITANSSLEPFFDRKGAFHTTLSVRKIWDLGYGYEGLDYSKPEAQRRQDVVNIVNRLYSTRRPATPTKRNAAVATTRYFAALSLDVAQVRRPCQIQIYVDGARAGSLVVMDRPTSGVVRTGFGLDHVATNDFMHAMTTSNAEGPTNSSVEVEIVRPDGSRIPLTEVTSLKVEVQAVNVKQPTTLDDLPEYGSSRRNGIQVTEMKTEEIQ